MASVKISQLNELLSISSNDFFAIVDSGSGTTYRVDFTKVATWMLSSGSGTAISAAYSSIANTAYTATSSLTASHLLYTGIYNGTASYAMTASLARTASYFDTTNTSVTNATNAQSASWASSSLWSSSSLSSSYASSSLSSSYALSASYSLSSSYALSSSHALIADALTGGTPTVVRSGVINGLSIYPRWQPYDTEQISIEISASEVVLYNNGGNSIRWGDVAEINNRGTSGVGGITGTFTANQWYDIWLVYNPGTFDTSTVIVNSGLTPNQSVATTDLASIISGGYSYYRKVGSVLDESAGTWRQWYEYGAEKKLVYRNDTTTNYRAIDHYFGGTPKHVFAKLKLKNAITAYTTLGFSLGDELSESSYWIDISGGSDQDRPGWTVTANSLQIKYGYDSSPRHHFVNTPQGGYKEPSSFTTDFDMMVTAIF